MVSVGGTPHDRITSAWSQGLSQEMTELSAPKGDKEALKYPWWIMTEERGQKEKWWWVVGKADERCQLPDGSAVKEEYFISCDSPGCCFGHTPRYRVMSLGNRKLSPHHQCTWSQGHGGGSPNQATKGECEMLMTSFFLS